MLSTPHLLVGAAIGQIIPNPALAIPLSFLSHFPLDAVPHWDGGAPKPPFKLTTVLKTILDLTFGLALIFVIISGKQRELSILASSLAAISPDIIQGMITILGLKWKPLNVFSTFHLNIQGRIGPVIGLYTSTVTAVIALLLFLRS